MSGDTTRTNSLTFVLCVGSGVEAIVGERCTNNDTMRASCVTFILWVKGVQRKDTMKTICISFVLGFGVGATVGERCTKKRHSEDKLC